MTEKYNIKTILLLSLLPVVLFAIFLGIWKWPYFSWHFWVKRKIERPELINLVLPFKDIERISKPPQVWQEFDFLEARLFLPENPDQFERKYENAIIISYPKIKLGVVNLLGGRNNPKIPFLRNGKQVMLSLYESQIATNDLTMDDIRFYDSSKVTLDKMGQLLQKGLLANRFNRGFIFSTDFCKGFCQYESGKKKRYLSFYSPKDQKGFLLIIVFDLEKYDAKQIEEITGKIIAGVKFSEGFPTKAEIHKQLDLLSTKKTSEKEETSK